MLFAVPAAGGMTVPLNTRLAPPEIAYMLDDSGAAMLFVDAAMAPAVQALQGRLGQVRHIYLARRHARCRPACAAFETLLDAPPVSRS